jgi:hypothetical protein
VDKAVHNATATKAGTDFADIDGSLPTSPPDAAGRRKVLARFVLIANGTDTGTTETCQRIFLPAELSSRK